MDFDYINDELINFIDLINKISKKIELAYYHLYQLEKQGKKDTDEFKKQIRNLKLLIELEEKRYQGKKFNYDEYDFSNDVFNDDLHRAVKLGGNISNPFKRDSSKKYFDADYFKSTEENIALQEYNDGASRRILSTLNKMALNDDFYISSLQEDKWLDKFCKSISSNNATKIKIKAAMIEDAIKNDFQNAFLYFLQDAINGIQSEEIKQELLKVKYALAIQNKDVENKLINNNFDVQDNISIESQITSELCSTKHLYEPIKSYFVANILKEQIDHLSSIKDDQYEDFKIAEEVIIRDSFIKAALVLANEKEIEEIKASYENFINSKNKDCYKISNGIIKFDFKNAMKSKEKALVYSLKMNDWHIFKKVYNT